MFPLVTAALLMTAACGDTPDPRPGRWYGSVDTLASGVVVVTNEGSGIWGGPSEGWSLREDLRIGSVGGEGPAVFGRVAAVAVDTLERIHVLDNQAREVRIFNRDGQHVQTIGRSGEGPGEFRNPWGVVSATDGSTWVIDPGNARYSRFGSAGDLIGELRRPVAFFSVPWPGGIDVSGRIYDVVMGSAGPASGPAREGLIQVTPERGVTDTIWLPEFDVDHMIVTRADGTPVMGVPDPFAAQLIWRFDSRGSVWSAKTDEYRILQQDFSGDTLRIIRREVLPAPVGAEARDSALTAFREMVASVGAGAASNREPRVPRFRPILRSIHVDPEGLLWVEPEPLPGEGRRFEVFGEDGRFLGEVDLPSSFETRNPRPVFDRQYIYGVSTDDLGVPFVVRLEIVGRT